MGYSGDGETTITGVHFFGAGKIADTQSPPSPRQQMSNETHAGGVYTITHRRSGFYDFRILVEFYRYQNEHFVIPVNGSTSRLEVTNSQLRAVKRFGFRLLFLHRITKKKNK